MSETAFLGLGSNLGDRLANLQRAADLLADEGAPVVRSSRVWETDPVGGPEQPDYLNAVVEVRTELDPFDLLAACIRVEAVLGRVRDVRWGPRTVDIDVLLFDDLEVEESRLTVPHPRLTERAFVLLPLMELIADPMLPDGTRVTNVRLGPGGAGGAVPSVPPLRTST